MAASNSQRVKELRKKREEENNTSSSMSNSKRANKLKLERNIGFDTFESDLNSIGTTINDIYSGWQTQETMGNTKHAVETMHGRISAYQEYQKLYGGTDISDIANRYQTTLDDWDKLTSTYGYYKNADAYNKAVQKSKFDKDFEGLTYDEVQAKKKEYGEGTAEYDYLSSYTGYTSLKDFEKALDNAGAKKDAIKVEGSYLENKNNEKQNNSVSSYAANNNDAKVKSKTYADDLETAMNKFKLDNASEPYMSLKENEDFAEKSQYKSTRNEDAEWWQSKRGDETYEYINNVDGIRTDILAEHDKYQVDAPIYTPSKYVEMGLDAMNEDEIAIYNYLYAKDKEEGTNKADEYLKDIEVMLTKRIADGQSESIQKEVDGSVGSSIALSLASPFMNVGGGIYSGIESISSLLKGEAGNPYSIYNAPVNMASDIRTEVGENIAEATEGWEIGGVNVPSFLYNTGMSMADSLVGATSLGKAYTPLMGMTAYQQTSKELTEAGASEGEIIALSLVSAIAEAGFEYASIDELFNIKNTDEMRKILINGLKQAGVEAIEETGTELVNIAADEWVRGANSEYSKMYEELIARGYTEEEAKQEVFGNYIGRLVQAGIGGALSGGIMGSAYSGMQLNDLSKTGKELKANERTEDVMGMFTPEEAETYALYKEYADKGVTAENISDAQLGNLYATKEDAAYNTYKSKKSSEEDKIDAIHTMDSLHTYRSTPNTKVKATGENVDITGVKKVDGETVLSTSNGDMKVDDIQMSSNYSEVLSYSEGMSDAKADLFVAQYDGTSDVKAYKESFDMAYTYGETGFSADSVLKNRGILTETQASAIYKSAITNKAVEQQKVIDDINAKYGKGVTVAGKFDDSIIDYNSTTTDGNKVNWNSLTSKQRDAITFVKGFSEATGANITFIKSEVEDGKRVGKNGSYNPETNTIEIDVYAGRIDASALNDSIIPTLSHEITHWMKAKSPAMYSSMREHIMETLLMDGKYTSDERIEQEMERIKKNHPDIEVTEEMAIDEIMARACEDMLSNSDTTRKMLNRMSKKEQKSFIAKVKETFENMMKWVNELLAKYKSTSKEAEILRQYKDRMKQLSKMWDKALEESVQTNQSLNNLAEESKSNAYEAVFGNNKVEVYSLRDYETIGNASVKYNNKHKLVDETTLQDGIEVMEAMAEVMIPFLEEEGILPPDIKGKTVFKNGSYGRTGENTTKCVRTLTYEDFKEKVAETLGRPLTVAESLLVSQKIYDIAEEPQCIYCYVASDRKAYDECLGTYHAQMDEYITKLKNGGDEKALYEEYLNGRKDTKAQQKRFAMWKQIAKSGKGYITSKDLATKKRRDAILERGGDKATQVRDSMRYAQAASWAKKVEEYRAYAGDILKFTNNLVQTLNEEYGFRMYSFSDFTPAFIVENMQMIIDASVKGLKSLAYTKDTDYVKIFGKTGQAINISCYAKYDKATGTYVEDSKQGAKWEEAQEMRKQYGNAGTVMVCTNDDMVLWALKQEWIDVVIPYHIVKTGTVIANEYDWNNYTSESADKKGGRNANIYPTEHNNDFSTYDKLLEEREITPRFNRFYEMIGDKITADEYMKLVNEVRLPASELSPVKPVFDLSSAMDSFGVNEDGSIIEGGFVDKGGYMGGWYRKGIDVNQEVLAVAKDIEKGKSSLDVDYGMNAKAKQKQMDKYGLTQYSDRDNVSVYESMGEAERLANDNMRLKTDIERLKATISNKDVSVKRFRSLADYLNKLAGSKVDRETLGDAIKDIYTYIQNTENLEWVDVVAKAYDVASTMIGRKMGVSTNYFKEVMSNIRKEKVSLSAEQIAEAEKLYGNYSNFHKAMFGRINIVKDGTSLDEAWKEWSKKYPAIFKENLGHKEKIQTLVDITDALRETSSLMGEYEREEAIRHLSTEIYNQLWNIASDTSDATKKAKAEHREMMETLRKEYEARQAEKTLHPTGELALKYERVLRRTKAETKRARELGKKRLDNYRNRSEMNKKIDRIKKNAKTLNEYLLKNSKDKHIAEHLKPMVKSLVDAIDYETGIMELRNLQKEGIDLSPTEQDAAVINDVTERMRGVRDEQRLLNALYKMKNSLNMVEFYGLGIEADVENLITYLENLRDNYKYPKMVLNAMSLEQLSTVDKLVSAVKSVVMYSNRLHTIKRNIGVDDIGNDILVFLDKLGLGKAYRKSVSKYAKTFKWLNVVPYYAFNRLGGGGKELFGILQDGWDKMAFNVKTIYDFAYGTKDKKGAYTKEEAKKWNSETHELNIGGKKYIIKTSQIMSLYCLWNREQAKKHILGHGIRISNFEIGKKVTRQTENITVTEEDVKRIISKISGTRAEEAAKAIQNFMNTTCKDWGNYVSMERFGYNAFEEENYFPIEVDNDNIKDQIADSKKNNSLYALLNMGFSKSLNENAKNAIMINDIFEVFANHASDMAKYNALGLAVVDVNRVMNYADIRDDKPYTIKKAMDTAYGEDAKAYFNKLIADLNGTQSVSRDVLGKEFMSRAKLASIGFNIKTVLLQPTAYLKASAVINKRYLANPIVFRPDLVKRGIERGKEHCGIALWKSLGFYDTNISRGVVEMIKMEETMHDKLAEKSTKWMERADEITWGALWNACELEIRDTRKDLKVGSDEFFQAVADRLREIIYATQVVDSTLTRSEIMRSGDFMDKVLTAFGSEPTLAYNMLLDCVMRRDMLKRSGASKQELRENNKKTRRVVDAYIATNLVTAILEAFIATFRDEDELEEDEIIKMMFDNFKSNMSIVGKIPYLKDFVSIFQGYSPSRLDTQGVQSLYYALNSALKNLDGEGSTVTTLKHLLKGYSSLEGLGFYNAYRDIMALLNKLDILTTEELEELLSEIFE